jgi:hypothetical protein
MTVSFRLWILILTPGCADAPVEVALSISTGIRET